MDPRTMITIYIIGTVMIMIVIGRHLVQWVS
jgi:hypothetical protein